MRTRLLGICLPSSPGSFWKPAHIRASSNAQAYLLYPDEAACTVYPLRPLLGNSLWANCVRQHRRVPGDTHRHALASYRQTQQPVPLRVPLSATSHLGLILCLVIISYLWSNWVALRALGASKSALPSLEITHMILKLPKGSLVPDANRPSMVIGKIMQQKHILYWGWVSVLLFRLPLRDFSQCTKV